MEIQLRQRMDATLASLPRQETVVVMAVAAHPDDIEFMMAGTLLLLGDLGAELHFWNLANGGCGSRVMSGPQTSAVRWVEAQQSAELAGARIYPPLVDDGMIFYRPELVRKAAARIRQVRPSILLLPSPQDYMEDHQNTSRLLVTAAFLKGAPNFETQPPVAAWDGEIALYHALPHGLRDGLRQKVKAGLFVDISAVMERKRELLACHQSQQEWLEASQGPGSYLDALDQMAAQVGRMSGVFSLAEGWRRHSNLGFARRGRDPMADLLGERCRVDPDYEALLDHPTSRVPD